MVFILVEYIKKPNWTIACGCLLNLNKYPSGESTNIELFVVQEWAVWTRELHDMIIPLLHV